MWLSKKHLERKEENGKKLVEIFSGDKGKTAKHKEKKKKQHEKPKRAEKKAKHLDKKPKPAEKKPQKPPEIKAPKPTVVKQKPSGEAAKKLLHNIYFSKPQEEERKPAAAPSSDRRTQDVEHLEKRIENMESSMTVVKDVVETLRKENEDLRKEKQAILDRMKDIEYIKSFSDDAPDAEEEVGGKVKAMQTDSRGTGSAQTSLDKLLDLVVEKGSIKLSAAAKKLGVKESDIEEWAKVLEEHELIDVHYPPLGKPVLKKKGK